ncbi:hypothetical protein C1932_09910 [Stenotrophomonas sp. YAU14D1_LEIMI4_1]|nr:hypothetical protein C1932_09910 [Stenotrophomonas sp. YAU14D1_LEIMI4_1]
MESPRDKDYVDVSRELGHWELAFNAGTLPAVNFRHEVAPIVRLACDIYIRNPHGTRLAWLLDLRERLERRPSLRGDPGAEEIAEGCWKLISISPL